MRCSYKDKIKSSSLKNLLEEFSEYQKPCIIISNNTGGIFGSHIAYAACPLIFAWSLQSRLKEWLRVKKNYISSRRLYKLQAKGVLEGGGNKKCANPDLLIEWTMSASNILARNIETIQTKIQWPFLTIQTKRGAFSDNIDENIEAFENIIDEKTQTLNLTE